MKLFLVQHGLSNEEDIDPEKNLSEQGRKDVEKIAAYLKNAAVFTEEIFHSGKARSTQTAEILAQAVQLNKKIRLKEGIDPDDPVAGLKDEIEARSSDLMLVGHMPFLGKLASLLLTGLEQSDIVAFQQGCVVCLEKFGEKWKLKWLLAPELL